MVHTWKTMKGDDCFELQAAQMICPEAEPKNYNNDNYNYIN